MSLGQSYPPITDDAEFSENDYQLIKSGTNIVCLVGWVEYKDVFGRSHEMGFTRRYDPKTNAMLPINEEGFEVRK